MVCSLTSMQAPLYAKPDEKPLITNQHLAPWTKLPILIQEKPTSVTLSIYKAHRYFKDLLDQLANIRPQLKWPTTFGLTSLLSKFHSWVNLTNHHQKSSYRVLKATLKLIGTLWFAAPVFFS